MNGRLLILPLAAATLCALGAIACNNDKPKADTTASSATASAPAATTSGASTAAQVATASAMPPASGSAPAGTASAATTAAAAATTAAPAAAGNVTYAAFTQKSHGYSLEVPSVFVAKVNPKNTDGQDWAWGDHGKISTVALPTIGESLDDDFNEEVSGRKGVTEKTKKDNWFLVKGADKGTNFVHKAFVTATAKTDLDITYDDALKGQIEPMVQHMLDTFKPGK